MRVGEITTVVESLDSDPRSAPITRGATGTSTQRIAARQVGLIHSETRDDLASRMG